MDEQVRTGLAGDRPVPTDRKMGSIPADATVKVAVQVVNLFPEGWPHVGV
jgi:hypothetical protein